MTRGLLIATAAAGAVAVLIGISGLAGTPASQVLLACGVVVALTLSRGPRRD